MQRAWLPMTTTERRLVGRIIGPEFNQQMLEILQASPIESPGLSICFDRQPDIFQMARLKYDPARYVGFFDGDRIVGFAMVGYHLGYVNGAPAPVMHFSDYYVLKEYRGRGTLTEAIKILYRDRPEQAQIGYAIVMQGNRAAEKVLYRSLVLLSFLGRGRIVGTLEAHNMLITSRRRSHLGYRVRRATMEDAGAIVDLLQVEYSRRLFGVVLDRDLFYRNLATRPGCGIDSYYVAEQDGGVVGVLAAWDTSAFKQNRVVRYGPALQLLRLGLAVAGPVLGFPRLPSPGEAFRDVHITDCAAVDRSPAIVAALLEHVYDDCRERRCNSMIFAGPANDPLLSATRTFRQEVVRSHIVVFSTSADLMEEGRIDMSLPFIDVALL